MEASKRYLVALDDSERAPHVLAVAARLSALAGASLVLVHAVGIPRVAPRTDLSPDEFLAELEASAARHLETLAAALPASLPVRRVVEAGVAADVVARIARDEKVELVVCGTHAGIRPLERALGSTATRIVTESPCSVYVVR